MFAVLTASLLLSGPLARDAGRPPGASADARVEEAFAVAVRGALDSRIDVRFSATLGKRFDLRRVSSGGERVHLRGILRGCKAGGCVLDLRVTEVRKDGVRKDRSFSRRLVVGEKELVCSGWVWWYEVTLTRR